MEKDTGKVRKLCWSRKVGIYAEKHQIHPAPNTLSYKNKILEVFIKRYDLLQGYQQLRLTGKHALW